MRSDAIAPYGSELLCFKPQARINFSTVALELTSSKATLTPPLIFLTLIPALSAASISASLLLARNETVSKKFGLYSSKPLSLREPASFLAS